jgi:hypothetical protein
MDLEFFAASEKEIGRGLGRTAPEPRVFVFNSNFLGILYFNFFNVRYALFGLTMLTP